MFNLIVKYFGVLKYIPLFPAILDAWMAIWTSIFSPQVTGAIDATEAEVSTWQRISVTPHHFGGTQFNFLNKEIGHIHSNGVVDILFDRKTKHTLVKQKRAVQHHSFPNSGWISFKIRSEQDVRVAVELLRLSYIRVRKTFNQNTRKHVAYTATYNSDG